VVQLEIGLVVELHKNTQHGVEPWIRWLENFALSRGLKDFGDEGNNEQQLGLALLERLDDQ